MKTPFLKAESGARRAPAIALVLAIPLAFSGCLSSQRHGLPHAIGEQLAANAINYNLAMEKSQNEMMLLNVIRAMQHRPLYLTDASKVTGTINGSFSLGLSLPFGRQWDGNPAAQGPTASPTVTYSTSPSMDVNLLDSQDFMGGFLTSVPPKRFAYYWNQGWEAELLLYLLVRKVDQYEQLPESSPKYTLTATFHNHPIPERLEYLRAFSSWVQSMVSKGRPGTTSGQPFQRSLQIDVQKPSAPGESKVKKPLEVLDAIAKDGGYSLSPFPGYLDGNPLGAKPPTEASNGEVSNWLWTLSTSDEVRALIYSHPKGWTKPIINSESTPPAGAEAIDQKDIGEAAALGNDFLAIPADLKAGPSQKGQGPIYVLHLRSPEGVLFYLGEVARLTNPSQGGGSDKTPAQIMLIHRWENDEKEVSLVPLFVSKRGTPPSSCQATIAVRTSDGSDFFVPMEAPFPARTVHTELNGLYLVEGTELCSGGESMHALSLLSQLIALQKSAKDFPTTSTVKVVGQ